MEGIGFCEDAAILCTAILPRLGFKVVLLENPNHLAFCVAGAENLKGDYILYPKTNNKYIYREATAMGWHRGEIPEDYRKENPQHILPITILIKNE